MSLGYKIKTALVSVGTTAVNLVSPADYQLKQGVYIRAATANSGNIHVGQGDVSVTSFKLEAGEVVFIPIDSADKIWVVGSAASQEFSYYST